VPCDVHCEVAVIALRSYCRALDDESKQAQMTTTTTTGENVRDSPRAYQRVTTAVGVTHYGERTNQWRSVNLSEGGLFVETVEKISTGTWVELGFRLGEDLGSREIVSSAEVVWNNDPARPDSDPNLPAGIGLRFVDLDEDSRQLIRDYIAEVGNSSSQSAPVMASLSKPVQSDVIRNDAVASETEAPVLAVGTELGSYRILSVLGAGGMGVVYLAQHIGLGREVALKKLHGRFTNDETASARFFEEARLVNRIHHENIVEITDFVKEGNNQYFVMELLDGKTVGEIIGKQGAIPVARALHIAIQLSDVLGAVHDNDVVHRDLKPDNIILLNKNGDPDFVKLLDFGIAKLRESHDRPDSRLTAAGVVLGTPGYMAPEYVLGNEVDHRFDIYALGVVLYQMLTARMPFEAESWGKLILKQTTEAPENPSIYIEHTLPADLDALILDCLAGDPADRPQTVKVIGERLRAIKLALWSIDAPGAIVNGEAPFDLQEPTVSAPSTKSGGSFKVLLGLAAVAAVAVAIVFLWSGGIATGLDAPSPQSTLQIMTPGLSTAPAHIADPIEKAEEVAAPDNAQKGKLTKVAVKSRPKRNKKRDHSTTVDETTITDDVESQYRSGLEHLRSRKALLAAEELQKVIKLSPAHPEAHLSLGKAFVLLGREDAAVREFETYLRLAPYAKDAAKLQQIVDAYKQNKGN